MVKTVKKICLHYRRPAFDPWVGKIPWRRVWQPTLVFLPGEFHGQRILVGYCPWGHKESDMTEQLSTWWLVAQLCPTLCGHLDCNPPGSSVLGILHARILEWVAIPFSRWLSGKESTCQCRRYRKCRRLRFDPWVGKIPWKRKWHSLQYPCLENPMDRGAWRATVHRVTKSQTGLSTDSYIDLPRVSSSKAAVAWWKELFS